MDWLRKVPIGQYVFGETGWLRSLDPRMKYAWLLFFLVTPVLASVQWRLGLVIALLLITLFSGLPYRVWIRPLLFLIALSLFVGSLAILLPASESAPSLAVRDPNELSNAFNIGTYWEIIRFGPFQIFNFSYIVKL